MVRISTRAGGSAAVIRRVASMPSIAGIRTSITTTSGRSRSNPRTASAPSIASPTTSMSSSASRIMRNPPRISAWSSAMSTRIDRRGASRSIGSVRAHHEPAARAGAVSNVPPNMATRSRMPISPWPRPAPPSAAAPRPSSATSSSQRVGRAVEHHARVRPPACLTTFVSASWTTRYAVRSTLGGSARGLPSRHGLDGQAGGRDRLEQRSSCARPGCGASAGSSPSVLQDADQPAHLRQAVAAGLLDACDRPPSPPRIARRGPCARRRPAPP